MTDYTGDVAIITGGASGLGAAAAKALAHEGLRVAIFDVNEDEGQSCAAELGGMFFKVDVSDSTDVTAALDQVESKMGTPRILVNSAGIGPFMETVSDGIPHDPELYTKTIMINLVGSFNCASQVAARMVKTDTKDEDGSRGVIINVASVSAYDGMKGQIAYAASKGGIVAMTIPMARDLGDKGIRVNTIAPGPIRTNLVDILPPPVQDAIAAQTPFPRRIGHPSEFGLLVTQVVANTMLNGETIRLDGGIRTVVMG